MYINMIYILFGEDTSMGIRASNGGYPKVRENLTISEKASTRAFSWLKDTIKTIC